jgi:hypothetical protein
MSRARLKVVALCDSAGLLTPGLGRLSVNLGEVLMVRKFLLNFEFALLRVLQVIGLVSALVGLLPAFAQTTPSSEAAHPSEAALNDPNIVQDFMAALPDSDVIKPKYKGGPPPSDQNLFEKNSAAVIQHRFYSDFKRGSRETSEMIADIFRAFTLECEAKGGRIEKTGTAIFSKTLSRLEPNSFGTKLREQNLKICMQTPYQAIGAVAVQSSTSKAPLISLRQFVETYTVIALNPMNVVTRTELDRETAAANEQWRRNEEKGKREQAELDRWRRSITMGTETGCGPVLRVNGDLIEVAYYQTREPKWFRRTELSPSLYNSAGLRTCN